MRHSSSCTSLVGMSTHHVVLSRPFACLDCLPRCLCCAMEPAAVKRGASSRECWAQCVMCFYMCVTDVPLPTPLMHHSSVLPGTLWSATVLVHAGHVAFMVHLTFTYSWKRRWQSSWAARRELFTGAAWRVLLSAHARTDVCLWFMHTRVYTMLVCVCECKN